MGEFRDSLIWIFGNQKTDSDNKSITVDSKKDLKTDLPGKTDPRGPPAVPEAYAIKVGGINPDSIMNVDTANASGNKLLDSGNLEMATKVFEKGADLNPYHVGVVFNLAVAYRLSGRFQEAKALCERLLKLKSSDWDAIEELKACQNKEFDGSKEYEEARRSFIETWRKQSAEPTQSHETGMAEQSSKNGAFRELLTAQIADSMETPDAKDAIKKLLSKMEFRDHR